MCRVGRFPLFGRGIISIASRRQFAAVVTSRYPYENIFSIVCIIIALFHYTVS
jgi:hypothetical protein